MRRWALERPTVQAERNEGPHPETGVILRYLVELEWSRQWLAEISDEALEVMTDADATDLRERFEQVDAAERRFLACCPDARGQAEAFMTAIYVQGFDDLVIWYRLLARRAEIAESFSAQPYGTVVFHKTCREGC
jgi:hypothetical protein